MPSIGIAIFLRWILNISFFRPGPPQRLGYLHTCMVRVLRANPSLSAWHSDCMPPEHRFRPLTPHAPPALLAAHNWASRSSSGQLQAAWRLYVARDATLASAAARLRVRCTFLRMHVHVFVPYVRRSRARRERRARVIQTCLGEPMLLLLFGYRHDETCRFKSSEIAVCGPGNWSASKKWSAKKRAVHATAYGVVWTINGSTLGINGTPGTWAREGQR